jgi:hypothetical protein
MAALNFPSSPDVDEEYVANGFTWVWNGTAWVSKPGVNLEAAIEAYFVANPVVTFDSGTKLLAAQTTAPTGWTKDTTHNNKSLRLVTGTVGTGGTNPFTSTFASRTPTGSTSSDSLSTAQLASHAHSANTRTSTPPVTLAFSIGSGPSTNVIPSSQMGPAGSGDTHSHTLSASAMDFAVEYVDVVIITKD